MERSMMLQWQLNCVDEPIVVGYNITYCAVDKVDECLEGLLWNISLGSETRQFEIQGLKAYTRYKISIALLSTTRHGIFKLPIFARTLESGE